MSDFKNWLLNKGKILEKIRRGESSMPKYENIRIGGLQLSRPIKDKDEDV